MDVAYVDGTGGTDAGTCAQGAACKTITAALTKAKGTIKVTNTVNDQVTVLNRNVQIFAGTNSKLTSTSNGALFTTSGTSVVELYDLAIADASGTSTGFGIQVGANTTVKMTRGKVSGCREAGITSSGGTVTVTGATVTANTGAGITSSGGTVTVTGATVTANKGGGISVTAGGFKIANCIVAKNGDDNSDFGGVNLTTTTTTHQFDNNTVVFNHQKAGALGRPGVNCTVTAFAGQQNIITSNDEATAFGAQTAGACTYTNSFVMPGMAAGANELKFKDIATNNYHLTSNSPNSVKDVPGLTSCTGSDFDGDMRPVNSLCDLGADELGPLNP
jgi:hypothetical protein